MSSPFYIFLLIILFIFLLTSRGICLSLILSEVVMNHLLEKFTLDELDRYSMTDIPEHLLRSYKEMADELDYAEKSIDGLQDEINDLEIEAEDLAEHINELEDKIKHLEDARTK
jgi:peptidoglycan hydrolase CwlO-like protein